MFPNNWGFNYQNPWLGQGYLGMPAASSFPTLNMPGFPLWSPLMPPIGQGFPPQGNQWNTANMSNQFPTQSTSGAERSSQFSGDATREATTTIPGLDLF